MIIEPYLIGPRLLDQPLHHQFDSTHLLMRLLLLDFATVRQLSVVSQKRLLETKMLQSRHKPHRRNQLVFSDILPAFILRHALLQQAQL